MICKLVTHIETSPPRYTLALSITFTILVSCTILVALILEAELESVVIPLPSARPPLAYVINALVLHSLGKYGVFAFHEIYSLLVFTSALFILRKIGAPSSSVAIFSFLLTSYLLWHIEVFQARDTILFSLALVTFFAILVSDLDKSKFLLLGAISGLGWLTRATGIIFIPMVFIVTFTIPHYTTRQRFFSLLQALATFWLVISPWEARILERTGSISLSPFPGNGIYNLVKGNNLLSADVYPYIDLDIIDKLIRERCGDDRGELHIRSVYDFIRANPTRFITLKLKEIGLFFLPIQVPLGTGECLLVNDKLIIISFFPYHSYQGIFIVGNLIPLLACGLYISYFTGLGSRCGSEKERFFKKVLLLTTALYLLLHLATWVETRFILPIHPLWFTCASIYSSRMLVRVCSPSR